jgi:ATP-dependent DNA helicase PIF1
MLVVLLVNLDISRGLVNGAQGTIQGFKDYDPKVMPRAVKKGQPDIMTGSRVLAGDYAETREAEIKKFITETNTACQVWPEVQFLNGQRCVIQADCTVHEFGDKSPYTLLMRTQIPLTAGYAMTTHKSQVGTLSN